MIERGNMTKSSPPLMSADPSSPIGPDPLGGEHSEHQSHFDPNEDNNNDSSEVTTVIHETSLVDQNLSNHSIQSQSYNHHEQQHHHHLDHGPYAGNQNPSLFHSYMNHPSEMNSSWPPMTG